MSSYTVTVDCDSGNDYNGRLGLRISSIFVIGFGSLCGALLPILAARTKSMYVPEITFFIAKYFGSGVIIATAFIHLLAPASDALTSPCLSGPITEYDWAEGIALMTIFAMFFVELLAARYDMFSGREYDIERVDVEAHNTSAGEAGNTTNQTEFRDEPEDEFDHSKEAKRHSRRFRSTEDVQPDIGMSTIGSDADAVASVSKSSPMGTSSPSRQISYPPGNDNHLGHHREHQSDSEDMFVAQMTAIFILEFGVIFHSIFIGLTLAVAGSEFDVLYIVLVFHQTFEGLGLGSRLATATWPKNRNWMPYVLGTAYGLTTPLAIAVGLGVRSTLAPDSQKTTIINGVFDSVSAGVLIYTGLVELMAHEFLFSPEMRRADMRMTLAAFGCMCLGAGLMALLGKWA